MKLKELRQNVVRHKAKNVLIEARHCAEWCVAVSVIMMTRGTVS